MTDTAPETLRRGRPPLDRGDMREAVRDDSPRARAAARAAQIEDHVGDLDEGPDDFYLDPTIVPDGWCYEWKTHTVMGAQNPSYQVQLARTGWEAVPVDRHPELMPRDWNGKVIERKGLVLMERPQAITDKVRKIEQKKARDQVRVKEQQLNAAPQGQFPRDEDERTTARIKKSHSPVEIPD